MPAAARQGDSCVPHCSPFTVNGGSSDVYVDGKPAARQGDPVTTHLLPGGRRCGTHTPSVAAGSSTVFINGKPMARMGDAITGCTRISQGSSTVFVG